MSERSFLKTFRRQFITGLIILIPVMTTVLLVSWFFRAVDGILGRHFARLFGEYIHGIGFVSLFLLIWLVGALGRTYLGSKLNSLKDLVIARIPLVGSIFTSIKQVSDGLLEMDESHFEQVVLVEYPRKGLYAMGFLTSKHPAGLSIKEQTSESDPVSHVFIPTAPNPTSGYILVVPEKDLYRLNLTVEDGLKLVLSLGVIHPRHYILRKISGTRVQPRSPEKSSSSPSQ